MTTVANDDLSNDGGEMMITANDLLWRMMISENNNGE